MQGFQDQTYDSYGAKSDGVYKRLIFLLSMAMAILSVLFIPVAANAEGRTGQAAVALVVGGALVFLCLGWLARSRHSATVGILLVGFTNVATLVGIALDAQVVHSLFYLVLTVLLASFTLRPAQVWLVAATNVVLVGTFFVLHPELLLPDPIILQYVMGGFLLLGMVTMIGSLYAYARQQSISVAVQARAEAVAAALALEHSNAELARTNNELRSALLASQSVYTLKAQFVATISHELRTPLTSIAGYAQLLTLKHSLPHEAATAMQIIHDNSRHLVQLITDLLDFSKFEYGARQANNKQINLAQFSAETVALHAGAAASKRLHLYSVVEPETPQYVYLDVESLNFVLLQLLRNAIRFTNQGEIILRVYVSDYDTYTDAREADLHYEFERAYINRNVSSVLIFEVADSGIGIAPDDMEHIFEPFYKVDTTNLTSNGGTGIGLAIVRRLTELLQGNLSVKSQLGEGSRFAIAIPFEELAEKQVGTISHR